MVHASGVHATVAGVALGLLTRCRHDEGEEEAPAERLEHKLSPISAGVAVPAFAFLAAGVPVGTEELRNLVAEPTALGVLLGLFAGKGAGVLLGAYATARFTKAQLSDDLAWWDVLGLAILSGVGFTVALLIGESAFAADPARLELVKAGVLVAPRWHPRLPRRSSCGPASGVRPDDRAGRGPHDRRWAAIFGGREGSVSATDPIA
ncbi:MAG: Na+/H+ antiporter NhaA [Dehalococcoidia bacterium]